MFDENALFIRAKHGSLRHNGRSFRSYCFKNLRNQVLPAFLTRNPYRSGSFQLGPENSSKSGTCSKTPLFYISKLNHTFSRCFHGAQCFVCRNPCSSMRILQKNMELRAGNREPKKTMELLIENAQLTENPMKCIGNLEHSGTCSLEMALEPLLRRVDFATMGRLCYDG